MAADAGTAIFRAIADFSRLRKEAAKSRDELRDLKDEAEDTGVALELIDGAADKAGKGLDRFAKAAAKAKRDLDGLADAAVDAGAGMELAAEAADDLADELDDVSKSAKRAERALKGLGNEAVETAAKLEAAALASESLGDRMGSSFDRASDRGSKLRSVLAEMADVQRDLGRNVDTTAGDLGTLSQRFGQLDGAGDNLVRRYTEQGDGLRALSRAGQDAAAAQEVLLRSQERQEDAAGRVRVAEEKLAAARAKGKADAGQIADLEEKLAAARRKQEQAARAVGEAEDSVAKAAQRTSVEVEKVAQASDKAAGAHERHGKAASKAGKEFIQLEADTDRSGSKLLRFATIAGGVVTALGALGGGAGMAVGGIVALGAAIGQLSGLAGLLPGVLGAAGLGVATLKIGLQGFGDVMSAVASGDLNAFNKAIAEMGPQAQETAKALWTWSPALQAIKKDTQEALVGGLGPALKDIGANYLPLVHDALQRTARAFNGVAKSTLDWLNQRGQIDTVRGILGNLALALEKAAPGAKNLASAFLTLFRVSSEQMPSLAEGFVGLTKRFDEFIQKAAADGSLKKWMDLGRAAAADLGVSLGNLAVVLGTVFTIGQEQGRGFFDVLRTVTGAMREFVTSAEGKATLTSFFANMHQAAVALMPALKAAAMTIGQDLVPAIASLATRVGPGLADLFDGVGDAINTARPGLDSFGVSVGELLSALGNAGPLVGTVLGGALRGLGVVAALAAGAINGLTAAFNALPAPVQSIIGHGVGIITMFTAIVAGAALLAGGLSTAVVAVRVFAQGLALLARGKAGLGLSMMFGNTAKSARKAQKEIGTFGKAVGKTIDPLTREIPLDKKKGKELDTLAGSSKKAATDTKTFTREVAASAPALNTATNAAKRTTAATGELGKAGATAGRQYPKTLSEGIKSGAAAAGTAAEGLATNAGAKGKAAAGKAGTEAGREYPRTLQQGLSPNSGGIANAMTAPIETGGKAATEKAGTHGGNAGRGFLSKLTGALRGGVGAITGALGALMGGFGGAATRAGAAGNTAGGGFISRMGARLRGGTAPTTAAGTAAVAGLGGAAAASAGAAGTKAGGGFLTNLGTRLRGGAPATTAAGTAATAGLGGAVANSAGAAGAKGGTGFLTRMSGALRGGGSLLGIAAGVGLTIMGSDALSKAQEQGRVTGDGYITDAKGHIDAGSTLLSSAAQNAWLSIIPYVGTALATIKTLYDGDRAVMKEYADHKTEIQKGLTQTFGEESAKQVETAASSGSGIVTSGQVSAEMYQQAWEAGWDGTNKAGADATAFALQKLGEQQGGFTGFVATMNAKALEFIQSVGGTLRDGWNWITGLFGGGSENAVAAAGVPLMQLGGKIGEPVQQGAAEAPGFWSQVGSAFSTGAQRVVDGVSTDLGRVGTFFSSMWTGITAAVSTGWTTVTGLFSTAGQGISTAWSTLWNGLGTIVSTAWTGITTAVQTGWTFLTTLWTTVTTALSTGWQLFWTGLTTVAQTAWTGLTTALQVGWTLLQTLWTTFTTALSMAWQLFWTGITTAAQTAWTLLQTGWQAFTTLISTLWTTFTTTLTTAWQTFWTGVQTIAQTAWQALQTGLGALRDFFAQIFQTISDTTRNVLQTAADAWRTIVDTVTNTIKTILQTIVDFLGGVFSGAWTTAQGVVQSVSDAIGAAARGFASAVKGAVDIAVAALDWLVGKAQAAASAIAGALGMGGGGNIAPGPRGMAAGGVVQGMATGGPVEGMASGGPTPLRRKPGPVHGSGRQDKHHRLLMSDEFVVNRRDSKRHRAALELINSGRGDEVLPPGMAAGGSVQVKYGSIPDTAWDQLLAMGYRGDPNDDAEALYPSKQDLALVLGKGASPAAPVSTPSAGGSVPAAGGTGAAASGGAFSPEQLRAIQAAVAVLTAQLTAWQTRLQTLSATGMVPIVSATLGQVLPALRSLQATLGASASATSSTNQTIAASYQQADQLRTSSTQRATSAISTASNAMAGTTSSASSTINASADQIVAAAQRVAAAAAAASSAGAASGGGDWRPYNAATDRPIGTRYEDGSVETGSPKLTPQGVQNAIARVRANKRDRGGRMGAGSWYRNDTGRPEYAFTEAQVLGKRRPPVDVSGMLGAVAPAELSALAGDYTPVMARAADFGDGGGPRGFTVNQTNNIISPKAEAGSAKLQAAGRQVARRGVAALMERTG
ncbi:hypothetical protein [Actinomycetospora termitidis]|uniref:Tape measure protein n=1 Tax=Actinomycetospora termitidis TaxID=3053470 RepID=A0ABT7MFF7_9PSEU|nr:hypothetical protein [Actinomycetospora sp. Odt1-22]MDL5159399.1 hypothetical protein [Actinomycetospora sp. Odt1-22]